MSQDLDRDIKKERDLLLLEYHKVEAVDRILKERAAAVTVSKANIKALDEVARREIRGQLRGGMLHRGIWRVERQSWRYFQVLIKRITEVKIKEQMKGYLDSVEVRKLLGVPKLLEEKLNSNMTLYMKRIVARTSRGGTLTLLIQNKTVDWDKLQKEVSEVLLDITSLITLLPRERKPEIVGSSSSSDPRRLISIEIAKKLRDLHPSIIFLVLTATMSTGYFLKELWKTAWPDEKQPVFLTINIKRARYGKLVFHTKEGIKCDGADWYAYELFRLYLLDSYFPKGSFENEKYSSGHKYSHVFSHAIDDHIKINNWESFPDSVKEDPFIRKELDSIKKNCLVHLKDDGPLIIIDDSIGYGAIGTSRTLACSFVFTVLQELKKKNQIILANSGFLSTYHGLILRNGASSSMELRDKLLDKYEIKLFHELENIRVVNKNIKSLKKAGKEIGEKIRAEELAAKK